MQPSPGSAELDALRKSAPDPYGGTPLGVEAAWCPNGIDVRVVATADTAVRAMEFLF
jgi:hypothetical protein